MALLTFGLHKSESVLIQKIFTHFKKAPGTHKLGVLYVVDSVTRKWLEQAKGQGQPISGAAQDGTYAAGVHRVTELMPTLMNDIICTAPEDQKVRLYTRKNKLVKRRGRPLLRLLGGSRMWPACMERLPLLAHCFDPFLLAK